MRIKVIKLVYATAQFVRRFLEVQLPVSTVAGLRTH
jgi:hypothetical protein